MRTVTPRPRRNLLRDRSGLALLEFAFTAPLLLMAGLYGVETANLALVNLRVSQIALNLADDASRVGDTPLSMQQLREIDVNDVLQAARYQGAGIQLTTRGRVIISSLENVKRTYKDGTSDAAPVQRIHWQRCVGMMSGTGYDASSAYGTASPVTTAGTDTTQATRGTDRPIPSGMGDPGAVVTAPPNSAVVFVEINYNYKPLLGSYMPGIGPGTRLHYVASFIVRDNRDFSQIFNPTVSPATKASTCDLHTVGPGGKTV